MTLLAVSATAAKKHFPKIVSLDAFGTLYNPKETPFKTYLKFGLRYGISKSEHLVKQDFIKSFKEIKLKYPNYGVNTDLLQVYNEFKSPVEHTEKVELAGPVQLRYSDNWWGLLIKKTFEPYKVPFEMTKELIEFFSGQAYAAETRLVDVIMKLKRVNTTEGPQTKDNRTIVLINSNGDPRVMLVLQHLNLIRKDLIPQDLVYYSYDTQVEKPNKESFDNILSDLVSKGYLLNCDLQNQEDRNLLLQHCWHIGDDFNTDLMGAINSGWWGVLIDRQANYDHYLQQNNVGLRKYGQHGSQLLYGDKSYIIKDFEQLELIFSFS